MGFTLNGSIFFKIVDTRVSLVLIAVALKHNYLSKKSVSIYRFYTELGKLCRDNGFVLGNSCELFRKTS